MSGDINLDGNRIQNTARITFGASGGEGAMLGVKDENDMASNSATYVATQQSIKAYVDDTVVPSGAFTSDTIKVMPNDFISNDNRVSQYAVIEDDTADTLGIIVGHSAVELYAFVKIPNGFKATHVIVYASASTSNAAECFEYNYRTGAISALASGTFDFNTNDNITDVTASASNDLVIVLSPGLIGTIIYGARVAIAAV